MLPNAFAHHQSPLVRGNVVISIDSFKGALAGMRNPVGGNVCASETVLDRERREAALRTQAKVDGRRADAIYNMTF